MAEQITAAKPKSSLLDALLHDAPCVADHLPQAAYKVDRLSAELGRDVVFRLQALPYGKAQDLSRFTQDADVNILLAGCVEPDLKDPRLLDRFDVPTPAEVVKKLLLPGEIADLSHAVERLTGYRRTTITELKNDLRTAGTGT